MSRIFGQLNHTLSRLDALEAARMPIRRYVFPLTLLGTSGLVMASNAKQAPDRRQKKAALTRDTIVIIGSLVGLAGGLAFSKRWKGSIAKQFRNSVRLIQNQFRPASTQASPANPHTQHDHHKEHAHHDHDDSVPQSQNKGVLKRLARLFASAEHHHHTPSHDPALKTALSKRLGVIFKSTAHDHGISALVELEALAAGSILGGAAGGGLADKLNGENLRLTMPAKLYEGIFQFLGNVTLCTIGIVGVGFGGKKAAKALNNVPAFKDWISNFHFKRLQNLAKDQPFNIRRVPTAFTKVFEQTRHTHPSLTAEDRRHFLDEIKAWAKHYYPEKANLEGFEKIISEQLEKTPIGSVPEWKTIEKLAAGHLDQTLWQELEPVRLASSLDVIADSELKADVCHLAKSRFEKRSELSGMLLGVGVGVIGGAWVSNQFNSILSKLFNLPKPSGQSALVHPESHNKGTLGGAVGERGLHWFDWVLHADDLPGCLYIAGITAIEGIIWILYSMSGYLTGIAGTQYNQAPQTEAPLNPAPLSIAPEQNPFRATALAH